MYLRNSQSNVYTEGEKILVKFTHTTIIIDCFDSSRSIKNRLQTDFCVLVFTTYDDKFIKYEPEIRLK